MAFNYRNPNADQYVVSNYDFFRLKQALVSAGDIFEVPQGGHAFALGPDSDISRATIAYVDPLSQPYYSAQASPTQTMMSTFTVSPQRPWAARIPAGNKEANYVPSGVPGRVLIWPTEIYDATYRPVGFDPLTDGLVFEPPVIDIMQFFSAPSTLVPQRVDKTYYYDQVPIGSSTQCFVLIPFYGRRSASIWAAYRTGGLISVTARGINFRISETIDQTSYLENVDITAVSGPQTIVVRPNFYDVETPFVAGASQSGLWDYLEIEVDADVALGNVVLKIVVSDITP